MENLGKYKIIRVIGEGGMGRVYEAVDPIIGRRVAIKTIAMNIAADAETRSRFFREAQAAGQLSHPNLITIHDIGEAEGQPYIVMEYLEGADLSRKIRSERLGLDTKMQIMLDVCDGLAFAHGHDVVHRDIKPGNIFVTSHGRVKILDFGLARGALSDVTRTGSVVGTPNYMAPEQIKGEEIDHRADIFSAGVVFYELLSGRKAFEGESIATTIYKVLETEPHPIQMLDAALPAELSPIIERAIAKDKTARFQSSNELLDALVRVQVPRDSRTPSMPMSRTHVIPSTGPHIDTAATVTTQVAPPTPAPQPARGNMVWQFAAIAAVVVAVAIGFFAFGRIQRSTPESQTSAIAPASGTAPAPQGAAPLTPNDGTAVTPAPVASPSPSATATAAPQVAIVPPVPAPPRPLPEPARPNQAAGTRQVQASAPSSAESPAAAPLAAPVAPAPPPAVASPTTLPEPRTAPIQPPVASTPAAPPPPAAPRETPPPVSTEAAATAMIQDVVARYQAALEARDIRALKRIWPSLAGRQEDALRMEFQNARAIDAALSGVVVRVAGATATVSCQRNYRVTTADRKALESATRMTMTLNNRDGGWAITNIQHEAIR